MVSVRKKLRTHFHKKLDDPTPGRSTAQLLAHFKRIFSGKMKFGHGDTINLLLFKNI
jgi:hypothetical protein